MERYGVSDLQKIAILLGVAMLLALMLEHLPTWRQ